MAETRTHRLSLAFCDPKTKHPLEKAQERIEQLIADLDAENEWIILRTPVSSEFLMLAEKRGHCGENPTGEDLAGESLNECAVVELAAMELLDRGKGSKKGG